ncbi:MAG: AAA family ATPase, partial [Planctomycetota bacterium]|nr:AAA family ATPase [Planctomycetota bacterium]
MATATTELSGGLLAAVLSEETFLPAPPESLEETGLPESLIESLIIKYLGLVGTASGRGIAKHIALPFGILESCYHTLRTRQIATHTGSAQLNDYYYVLTEQGRERAHAAMNTCAYVGPAPVPLEDYVVSVEAQTIRAEAPKRDQLVQAFSDISVNTNLFESLGPAVNSGTGLFLYGAPGNGKSTLARRITQCFGQHIWVPNTLIEDGQLIKLYDAAYHQAVEQEEGGILRCDGFDARWLRIRRPTVMVGGELTLDNLEIRHDPACNISEAPLQMKSNCGCLLIDDFGRQRVEPGDLLNRWIVPLENGHDFLTLSTGKKIQVPFEQLIIFSTNLEPSDLVDDAFLRRIPYKIEIGDADETEFRRIFEIYAEQLGCPYDAAAVDYLIDKHYRPMGRPMRRCQPRDLLSQIKHYCSYNDLPLKILGAHFQGQV